MGRRGPNSALEAGLAAVLARAGLAGSSHLERLTGGATMESWRFRAGPETLVLRRAPSAAFLAGRPFGPATEAGVIAAARRRGVTAPEVVIVLEEGDELGPGFIMRALPGTADPALILQCADPEGLLGQAARDLARIHSLRPADVPAGVPVMNYRAAIADLTCQFMEAGGDRPIIALGLKWLEENCPPEAEPVLNHGDYRLGNLLVEGSTLTGVLDWELAHFGDPHEDLAFGCMAVWRFARYDRPALGLGSLEDYFAAYEAESGATVDPARFRFWTIYRTVWWALGCLKMAAQWRSGADRMLERVVISRRTSEQELDLLLLLEEGAPEAERNSRVLLPGRCGKAFGEASVGEIAIAVGEWLGTIKDCMEGHDRFQLALARNALGIVARQDGIQPHGLVDGRQLVSQILEGRVTLETPALLSRLRTDALVKAALDSPKYPALRHARREWTGED